MQVLERSRLTERDHAAFERDGFLVRRGFYDAAEMQRLRSWVAELEAWPEAPGKYMKYFETSLTESGRNLINRIENFAPYHAGMNEFLTGAGLLDCMTALFGAPAVLYKEKINFKMPGGGGFEPHQDSQAGWEVYTKLFITAMIPVDATTIANGCLELAHWRHRRELVGEEWKPITPEQLAECRFEPCPTEPGDVVLFDSYLPHRSAPNLTAEPRRVLYITYNRLSEGDHRARYYADKRKNYPPDCEREPGKTYQYKI